MLIKYCGKGLFTITTGPFGYGIELAPAATVSDLRRFISRVLMDGLSYRGSATRQLAFGISQALMTPDLQWVQGTPERGEPPWFAFIVRWSENYKEDSSG